MSVYEVDNFLSPPDPDLICCICRNVLCQPVESPCQHVFCKGCIATWLAERRSCPSCRQALSSGRLKPVLPIVRNMINRLLVKCENHQRGCGKGVKLEAYQRHVRECDHALVGCMNAGCARYVLRKDMLRHETECDHRLTKCKKGCGLPVTVAALKSHSCVQSLKTTMQAMEESFNKRLRDLEDTMRRSYEDLEERVSRVEGEWDSYRHPADRWDHRYEYDGHSDSRSRSRSRSPAFSRSRSRSPAPSYDSYRSRRSRGSESSDGFASPHMNYGTPDYYDSSESEWQEYFSGDERNAWNEEEEDSNEEAEEASFSPPWEADEGEPESAPAGGRREQSMIAASERRTPHSRTRIEIFVPADGRADAAARAGRQPQGQGTGGPNRPQQAGSSSDLPGPPRSADNATATTSASRQGGQQSSAAPARPQEAGSEPLPPGDAGVSGSLYGIAVGDTDSEDTEWQPGDEPEDSTSESDATSATMDDDDIEDNGHNLSSSDLGPEPATTAAAAASGSRGRSTRSTKRRRVERGETEGHPADGPTSSRRSLETEGGARGERSVQREEAQNLQASTSRRRTRSPSAEADDPGSRRRPKKRRK